MNGADLLIAALENEGVKQIFGASGEENLDIVEALRRSTIKLVVTRHEQAAAFMAATHGRLTARPGVCLSTLEPGALNLTTAAAARAARRDADDHDHRPNGSLNGGEGTHLIVATNVASSDPNAFHLRKTCHACHQQF
jgi:hypothetical protein